MKFPLCTYCACIVFASNNICKITKAFTTNTGRIIYIWNGKGETITLHFQITQTKRETGYMLAVCVSIARNTTIGVH